MFEFLFNNRQNRKKGDEQNDQGEILPPAQSDDLIFAPLGRLATAVKSTVYEINRGIELETEEQVRAELQKIAVVAFVGSSGTGKSTRAISVARENGISYIIDDGILIYGSNIIAGSSAKRADTKIEAVKGAIFAEETRAQNMRRALLEEMPPALMILGTSRNMIERICGNLWLQKPSMLIRIEDVASEEERRLAQEIRMTEGKHTIPVPSMEIRHEFSGSLAEPIYKLRRRFDRVGKDSLGSDVERTVVRPTFSTLGKYTISDEAMAQIVRITLKDVPGVAEMKHFRSYKQVYGANFDIDVSLYYGFNAQDTLRQAQEAITESVEKMTSINILRVDLNAVYLVRPDYRKLASAL